MFPEIENTLIEWEPRCGYKPVTGFYFRFSLSETLGTEGIRTEYDAMERELDSKAKILEMGLVLLYKIYEHNAYEYMYRELLMEYGDKFLLLPEHFVECMEIGMHSAVLFKEEYNKKECLTALRQNNKEAQHGVRYVFGEKGEKWRR